MSSTVRFLPKFGEAYTQVSLLSGHSFVIHPNDPVDGKAGTVLPVLFHEEAHKRGATILGVDRVEEQVAANGQQTQLIVNAIRAVALRNDSAEIDGAGRPTLAAVKKQAGFGVTKRQYDDAWPAFEASVNAGVEDPIETDLVLDHD